MPAIATQASLPPQNCACTLLRKPHTTYAHLTPHRDALPQTREWDADECRSRTSSRRKIENVHDAPNKLNSLA
ncbi:unnamed protein product [Peniophora sp. CBMAI 1063]|nr:unnamed protein product [Peniophora sp. CBMAI 1063]